MYKLLLFVFKSLNDSAPAYIDDLPKPYNPPRKLRSDNLNLIEPKSDRSWGDWSFSHAAPRLWNQLPSYVKSSVSLIQFAHLFNDKFG